MIREGFITEQTGHIVDIVPTLIDISRIEYPSEVNGKPAIPLHGSSLFPIFKGDKRSEPDYFISGFTERFRMFRASNWKIVRVNNENWELYDLDKDRTETHNLADSMPGKLKELNDCYDRIKARLDLDK
jgi:arylsulfatase A-like enzyme